MQPKIVLVGRSNVGKSTIYRQITQHNYIPKKNSFVKTIDIQCSKVSICNFDFLLIDTSGFISDKKIITSLERKCINQTLNAIQTSDIIFFVVNGNQECTYEDKILSKIILSKRKQTFLLLNIKCLSFDNIFYKDFYNLGFHPIYTISSLKKTTLINFFKNHVIPSFLNINSVSNKFDSIQKNFLINSKSKIHNSISQSKIVVTVIGKPNVGKSTLVNSLTNSKRIITDSIPGTTKNSVLVPLCYKDQNYLFIDTAGIRKIKKINCPNEKMFIKESLNNLGKSDIILLIIEFKDFDCQQNIKLINFSIKQGCSILIIVNKCDLISANKIKKFKKFFTSFFSYSKVINFTIHFISALFKIGITSLIESIKKTYTNSFYNFNSSQLTKILHFLIIHHQPPLINNKRIKLKFAHPGGTRPLKIIIYGNRTDHLTLNYKTYLLNNFKKLLKITNNPLILIFKKSINPFIKK
ncbi:GTPase [Buchnera aphidicola (Nipponaphis monzeni)]|uniref:GTPase Der n=1 Tax=Buchnera aphidicola (Nipponaphis monzeni) TaxID=2495405 RepID=A0A455TAX5_9GAMM|nr:ribosome biogenesis GTPase Der [Buchnera aphidicola]BBI01450.1 GTPase [Buchnera aphidicola (Nipponaphis monzeni)]